MAETTEVSGVPLGLSAKPNTIPCDSVHSRQVTHQFSNKYDGCKKISSHLFPSLC